MCIRDSLELRGPRNDLRSDPRNSRAVRSAPVAQIPNLTTSGAVLGIPRGFQGGSEREVR
eukprot:6365492-Alexandrium_andersonii.AAC.1